MATDPKDPGTLKYPDARDACPSRLPSPLRPRPGFSPAFSSTAHSTASASHCWSSTRLPARSIGRSGRSVRLCWRTRRAPFSSRPMP